MNAKFLTSCFILLTLFCSLYAVPPQKVVTLTGGIVVEIKEIDCVTLYPTPSTTGLVTFVAEAEGANMVKITVKDLNGNTVFSQEYESNTCVADFSGLGEGYYTIRCITSVCETDGSVRVSP